MKWIRVGDQLPEKDQYIIYHAPGIFNTGPQMWIGRYDPEANIFFSTRGFFGGNEVMYWTPLPALPPVVNHVE